MATWKNRGLRGSAFETLINNTNEYYRKKELALVQKIPTPIVPLKFDNEKKLITEAYFEKDSTVDYIGVVQEIPICFDAKECATDTFSFLLILFTDRNDIYYMRFSELKTYHDRIAEGHAKNFKYIELEDDFFLKPNGPAMVPYLEGLNRDLEER